MENKSKGTLFLVPTPIGNLEDITLRALRVLKEVDLILAEDTRNSGWLLKHFNINNQMKSYHQHNEKKRTQEVISYLKEGKDIALISDAGSPGISDPSNVIVKELIKKRFPIEALPGATAFVPALSASGLNTNRFIFVGFLPKKNKERIELLNNLKFLKHTLIFYESPNRINQLLYFLKEELGDRYCVIAREISKKFESFYRGNFSELLKSDITLKGEFVVLCEGVSNIEITDEFIIKELKVYIQNGLSKKNSVKKVAKKYDISKNRVYKLSIR